MQAERHPLVAPGGSRDPPRRRPRQLAVNRSAAPWRRDRSAERSAGRDAPPPGPAGPPDPSPLVRLAVAEAELAAERRRSEELRADRDAWRAQAERLALPAPVPARRWW